MNAELPGHVLARLLALDEAVAALKAGADAAERGIEDRRARLYGNARRADDNDPLPVAQRPPRIAALERALDELHRMEEVLVAAAIPAGQPVHRSPSAPPAAVLGVRVADKVSRAA
jgi:hypothetical protein